MVSREQLKDFVKKHLTDIVTVVFSFIFLFILFSLAKQNARLSESLKVKDTEIQTMRAEHAKNINALQNELDINRANAVSLQKYITKSQQGITSPTEIFYVSDKDDVQEMLETRDSKLPPLALKNTDRTVVIDQSQENKEIPVGVYKVNLYRNWEIGVGAGVEDGKAYIPLAIQRNYDRSHSVGVEIHYSPSKAQISGAEIQYRWRF